MTALGLRMTSRPPMTRTPGQRCHAIDGRYVTRTLDICAGPGTLGCPEPP